MKYIKLKKTYKKLFDLIKEEEKRQQEGLEMIPSENYTSEAVLEATGSILTNKYAEGYPGKRYYGGNQHIDEVEKLAIERAKKLFKVPHANVQPYSGSPANMAVYLAVAKPGNKIMGLDLPHGGHLSHGWKVSFSGTFYKSIPYHVDQDGRVDFGELLKLAEKHKPKLIWCGATAYPRQLEFEKFAKIANLTGAYLAADIAHVAGLIAGGVHKSPAQTAHVVTTTTHKTLRGPRAGMVMVTEKGLKKDPELAKKIDKAVFPGIQGGPHEQTIAGIAVCLKEADSAGFKTYAKQVVKNAKALAEELKRHQLMLVSGGTENHLILIDLTKTNSVGAGILAEKALGIAGITVNKNTVPGEQSSPFYPSGIRLGTPALTTRGMKEREMKIIGGWIAQVIEETKRYQLPAAQAAKPVFIGGFVQEMGSNKAIARVKKEVVEMAKRFPVPGVS
jgi:glycine hydroxymethyltransferase